MTLTFSPPPFVTPQRPVRRFGRRIAMVGDRSPQSATDDVGASGLRVRPMVAVDTGRVHDFLIAQYETFNAADNTPVGHAHFQAFVSAPALRDRLDEGCIAHVAERDGTVLGMCELHLDGYLTLLYVRGDHHGRGIGRRLLKQGLETLHTVAPAITVVRVRGTPYARGFYTHMGFEPLADALQEDHGIRFHPFLMRLPTHPQRDTVTGT
ncbi:GNAT family N-acetyltransferase [Roseospira marina]|nr:GNAT family N-acetyltransferase [Roseospira marina]MBB4312307.1 GNAT superfamily N-acetyltransferase [Roseospira marina]MBB5085677.1 GNAT superfamily N-acetyltransferase [Roseospira marina]